MIAIANILNQPKLPGNYFAADAYVKGDFELGLLTNRQGARLLALPHTLLEAIQASLVEEVGEAAHLVLFECGRWWGKNFYRRFNAEVSDYYGQPLAHLEMVAFIQCLRQCWKTYGLGLLDLDTTYYAQGFLGVSTQNSAFAAAYMSAVIMAETPVCDVEAGFLSAFFSQLTGQDLHCLQTTCESNGSDYNHFVLGLRDRLDPAVPWIAAHHDHATIMDCLCRGQGPQAEQPQEQEQPMPLSEQPMPVSPMMVDLPDAIANSVL